MSSWYWDKGKKTEQQPEPATVSGPNPGDFPLGSLQSRAAARSALERQKKTAKVIRFISQIHRPPWAPIETADQAQEGGIQFVFVEDMTPEEREKYPCPCAACRGEIQ